MFENVTPIIIKAVTPVHAGSGREIGFVDMPIQKESHTDIPKIEGSSVKGCMRQQYKLSNHTDVETLFGHENGNDGAGLIGFSDAKLLFYPIKSLHNLFSYVTCPYLLNRLIEDLQQIAKEDENIKQKYSDLIRINPHAIPEGKAIIFGFDGGKRDETIDEIILDVFSFTNAKKEEYNPMLKLIHDELGMEKDMAVLSDEDFIELIAINKEIITRNRIGESGIVEEGGLFTEEYLPAESILYTLLLVNGIINDNPGLVVEYKNTFPKTLQMGGNSTIGKGIVKMRILMPSKEGEKDE